MAIKNIFIVGSGLMGAGIAQVALEAGYHITLCDINQEQLNKAYLKIKDNIKTSNNFELEKVLKRLKITTTLEDAVTANLVIEAIPENINLKKQLLNKLDSICPEAILATNTSSLMITELASATSRPEMVIGMHFASPVPLVPVVEIIKGLNTSDKTTEIVCQVVESLGKKFILVRKDYPGFIFNRILSPMINEAVFVVMEGIATPEEIDMGFRMILGHRMGPLETADLAGLDVVLAAIEGLSQQFEDSKYRPCPLLKRLVNANQLGKKTGTGFYYYRNGEKKSRNIFY